MTKAEEREESIREKKSLPGRRARFIKQFGFTPEHVLEDNKTNVWPHAVVRLALSMKVSVE